MAEEIPPEEVEEVPFAESDERLAADVRQLFRAVEHQRIEEVRRIIAEGVDVNCDLGGGWTPLVHAIDTESDAAWQAHFETGHESTELTACLLAAGAVPTDRAFEVAEGYGNLKAVELLRWYATRPTCREPPTAHQPRQRAEGRAGVE